MNDRLEAWIQEYAWKVCIGCQSYHVRVERHLIRYQAVFESEHPGEVFTEALRTTAFLARWVRRPEFVQLSESARRAFLRSLRGFTGWLLAQGHIGDNAYFYVATREAVRCQVIELELVTNLQQDILGFDQALRSQSVHGSCRTVAVRAAHLFNLYRNRVQYATGEDLLVGWLHEQLQAIPSLQDVRNLLAGLERFSQFVGPSERMPDAAAWRQRYRSGMALIRAAKRGDSLVTAERRERFQSELKGWLEAFLRFQQARQMRLDGIACQLGRLDRLALRYGLRLPDELTPAVMLEFLGENEPAPATYNARLGWLRGFARFLTRQRVNIALPAGWLSKPVPVFRPHLFTLAEIARILEHLRQRPSIQRVDPFRWMGLETLIYLLYAGAMRRNEPLRLNLGHVDIERRLLWLATTKFYKQRWVPVGERAAQRLADYLKERRQRFPDSQTEDPVFVTSGGQRLGPDAVEQAFRQATEAVGIRSRGTRPRPRLHDLRHTAAVHKLYQWYSEGADVQAKLPLLSAYLGHDRLHHTEAYLHLTEDLLRQAGGNFRRSFEEVVGPPRPTE